MKVLRKVRETILGTCVTWPKIRLSLTGNGKTVEFELTLSEARQLRGLIGSAIDDYVERYGSDDPVPRL